MLATINFNHQPAVKTYEVYGVCAYKLLTAEFYSLQLFIFQPVPEGSLGISLFSAKLASEGYLLLAFLHIVLMDKVLPPPSNSLPPGEGGPRYLLF